MNLSPQEKEKFWTALLSAYRDYDALKMMVAFKLGQNLDLIVDKKRLDIVVFEIIQFLEPREELDRLIVGAYEINPKNSKLKHITFQLLSKIINCPKTDLDNFEEAFKLVRPSVNRKLLKSFEEFNEQYGSYQLRPDELENEEEQAKS